MTKPVRLTREESRTQTRLRLLEAAKHIFAKGGYGGASVDMVAAEAGYSKGAFYSNFVSKEQIFLELLAWHMATEAAQLEHLLDADRPIETVLDSIDLWFEQMNDDADWALLAMELQLHARRSPAFALEYDGLYSRQRDRLGELISRLFAMAGKLLPAPAPHLAAAMIALAHGLVLQRTTYPEGGDPAGALLKTVLKSLLGSAEDIQCEPGADQLRG